ncbi:copper resistance protein B [Caulobacter sp. 17J65-9]|uniref:copper resistance protein B n=1 Tax=Caulobacter sp. 17J65-9 TaxID=2709382 RepID=UPI0013CBBEB0|nr:copper resistance protein B [Caulobacter sp. 17J65-9]NEX91243.1 copper resistance protein CopB [Caulobacter sp. 17J65-9]
MKSVAVSLVLLGAATPALAQIDEPQSPPDPHAGHQMPGMEQQAPVPQATDPHAGHTMPGMSPQSPQPPAAPLQPADPHAGHPMPGMEPAPAPQEVDPHAGHVMPDATTSQPPAEQTPGMVQSAPPPPAPTDHAADRYFDRTRMEAARHHLKSEHGGIRTGSVVVNLAEYQFRDDDDAYRWDAEGWFGGDVNRFVLKTEGEGTVDADLEDAEVQALYARAIGPYFNLEAGLRYDFEPESRTYAVLGVEGVAPYWFDLEAAAFLSDEGDLLGRVKASQDFRLTQRLLFQPRLEMNLAAQDVPESEIGAGLSNIEFGIRLRYEIKREFAPYVGVSWESAIGDTADFARAGGEDVSSTSIVVGLRTWF